MSTRGLIWNIQRFNIHDGQGIRTIVFLKGCPLSCLWCANPEGQEKEEELKFDADKCIECLKCLDVCSNKAIMQDGKKLTTDKNLCNVCGDCIDVCPVNAREKIGKWVSVKEVIGEVIKDKPFYRRSQGGLTLSGGEPLNQPKFTEELLKEAKAKYINTAIETSGYNPWEVFEQILPHTDQILIDIKHMDTRTHESLTGVNNKLILTNAKKLSFQRDIEVIYRVPIIPGINDSKENLQRTAQFAQVNKPARMEILPYHELGVKKYKMIGLNYHLLDIDPPDETYMIEVQKIMNRIYNKIKIVN